MVIRRTDRVHDVLARDEGLIDVFVRASPAFERLRNPALRKVMTRLVTVEQAARIGRVDADALIGALNEAVGTDVPTPATLQPEDTMQTDAAPPPALEGIPLERIVDCDVREDLRAGREPFARIMSARREIPEGGVLRVRAIFEPAPLYAVMGRQGLDHWTEQLAEDDWRVWFYEAGRVEPSADSVGETSEEEAGGEDVVVLDVRGFEPPEPMVRTLAALETLPPGATLVQLNVRVPQFLLPQLEQRGFAYEVREQGPDLVRLFIRRAPTSGAGTEH